MNALNGTLLTELLDALSAFDTDEEIGAMVIAGNERVFAAGADISEMVPDVCRGNGPRQLSWNFFDDIRKSKKRFIAAVSGYALWRRVRVAMSWI